MHLLPNFITDLALILGSAAVISILFKLMKQPVVLGYLLAGLLVGPNFKLFPTVVELDGVHLWAEIGVIFLLFGLGLEFSFRKLIRMSSVAGITAFIEVLLTLTLGYLIGKILGWKELDCLFFGGILAIASTTIIIRSFEELGVKTQNFAGLVTGILVMEDLVAVVLMVVLSTVSVSMSFEGVAMLYSILKLIFFLVLWFVSGIYFLPSILKASKRFLTEETLLIVSVALCLLMVVLASVAEFSPALGAFIMGSILAETNKAEKIEHLIKPLQNIFGAVFFVSVGMLINIELIIEHIVPVLIGVMVLLFAKPLFVACGALLTGQTLKTSVRAGMSLSQIGEFSFIIASLGLSLNVVGSQLYPIAVAISVITTFTTPFMIKFSSIVHDFAENALPDRWRLRLMQYAKSTNRASEISEWRKFLRVNLIDVTIFSVLIIFIILLGKKYLPEFLTGIHLNHVISTGLTLIVLSPLLWALMFRGTRMKKEVYRQNTPFYKGPLFIILLIRVFLGIVLIGFLFEVFFSTFYALIGVICSSVFLVVFRKKIQNLYFKMERRFVTNLNERNSNNATELLAPWDSHMTTIELDPGLSILGKPLVELGLREQFSLNIAIIKRGELVLNVPDRTEKLYPYDRVTLIGTDSDLLKFRTFLEQDLINSVLIEAPYEVSLHHFSVSEDSPLIKRSIKESKLREQTRGLVVGIERNEKRILNPDSNLILQADDTIWLVGDLKRIQVYIRRNSRQ